MTADLTPTLFTLSSLLALLSLLTLFFLYRQNRVLKSRQKDLAGKIADRDDIISLAAHEISAPLTNIKGTLAVIAKDPILTLSSQKFMERALISVEELIALIDGLLTVSRFEMGKIRLSKSLTDVEEISLAVINQLKPMADKEGLGLAYQKPKEALPKVSLDPLRFKEVLVNLVGNAVKYGAEGSVLLSLSLVKKTPFPKESSFSELLVSVSNNGAGIAPADLKSLFQRFVRLPANKDGRAGVGLGLYISRLIVEAHGGKIWAESKLGQGTTFYFSIPIEK